MYQAPVRTDLWDATASGVYITSTSSSPTRAKRTETHGLLLPSRLACSPLEDELRPQTRPGMQKSSKERSRKTWPRNHNSCRYLRRGEREALSGHDSGVLKIYSPDPQAMILELSFKTLLALHVRSRVSKLAVSARLTLGCREALPAQLVLPTG
jgi:hypothetical protein